MRAPASEESIKIAHDALDLAIAKGFEGRAVDLVIATEDEVYCIKRFREMITERQGEVAKNFIQRFDKLCKKS
jgi:hypothetical protein